VNDMLELIGRADWTAFVIFSSRDNES